MALTSLEDLIFFDTIGMIDLSTTYNSVGGMETHLNQMPPEAVKALEIQVANSVSNDLGLNTYTDQLDFWGMGFYADNLNVQTMGPTTDILDTTYESVPSTPSTPTTIPALPAATTPCLTCKDGDLMATIQKHKKAVGLGVLVVLIIAAFTIGKSL